MARPNHSPSQYQVVIMILAGLALIFVVSTVAIVRLTTLERSSQSTDTRQLTSSDVPFSPRQHDLVDPYITVVPDDQMNASRKTKVFISSEDPIVGDNQAQVYVILFGNLVDTTMADYMTVVTNVVQTYQGQVAVVWKDVAEDDSSRRLAVVGHCANEQGVFWEYARAVQQREADDEATLVAIAEQVGANALTVQDCIQSAGYSGVVSYSTNYAQSLGVINTHTVFINDQSYADPLTIDQLIQNIDAILATY